MTRSRDPEGRSRRSKAPTACICSATSNSEQPDGAGQRETATGQLTVSGGIELLDVPSRAPSRSSATGDQEGVGRGGRASTSDQETPKALRRAIGRTPLDPARTRSRAFVGLSMRRRAQIDMLSLSHHRPHHPVQSRISRPPNADAPGWHASTPSVGVARCRPPGGIWPAPRKTEQHAHIRPFS